MGVADKSRKILWGRSGNRCAICHKELVIAATPADDDSVVGDECHIISGAGRGPRHDPAFPAERLDDPENLVLLCRVHHKMVDDQHETYTVEKLRTIKADHERWVSSSLGGADPRPHARVRRIRENIPKYLVRLTSGRALMSVLDGAYAFSFDHDEPQAEAEVDLLSGFLQEAQDWGDLSGQFEAGERVRAGHRLGSLLKEVEAAGFWVFGGREVRRLEGEAELPSAWPVAIIEVLRADNPEIISVDLRQEGSRPSASESVRTGE